MFSKEGTAYGRNFKPRPSDVFIATFAKCGTTWTTQICHQLRSNGDMNFDEITLVAPWDATAKMMGLDLDADQAFSPRLFKSHEKYPNIAKGGKYILVVRDPKDAFVSRYNFILTIQRLSPEDLSMLDFAKGKGQFGTYSEYYAEWFEAYKNKASDIMVVFYEDLKADPEKEINRIANFMEIEESIFKDRVKTALDNSSLEFMQAHKSQFDDNSVFAAMNKGNDSVDVTTSAPKVVKGKMGVGKTLTEEVKKLLEAEWDTYIGKPLGLPDYPALKAAFQKLRPS